LKVSDKFTHFYENFFLNMDILLFMLKIFSTIDAIKAIVKKNFSFSIEDSRADKKPQKTIQKQLVIKADGRSSRRSISGFAGKTAEGFDGTIGGCDRDPRAAFHAVAVLVGQN